jgi:hypothetical protein
MFSLVCRETYYYNTDITQFCPNYLGFTPADDKAIYELTSPMTVRTQSLLFCFGNFHIDSKKKGIVEFATTGSGQPSHGSLRTDRFSQRIHEASTPTLIQHGELDRRCGPPNTLLHIDIICAVRSPPDVFVPSLSWQTAVFVRKLLNKRECFR